MTAPILEGLDLRVLYAGRPVLEVPRIEVRAGEILAIIGPNGAGKSTLLRVLGLLEPPTSGIVRFRGSPVAWGSGDLLATRRHFASVFQEPLLCDTTVEANIALGLRLRRAASEAVTTQVQTWLAHLGIAHLARREAGSLSGGEAQRCSLARAFAIQPDVLLLDEPFAALDPPTKDELLTLLQVLLRQEGCTTVFVTHDRDEAARLAHRVAVLAEGRLCQVGPTADVFSAPADETVASYVGVETVAPARVLSTGDGLVVLQVGAARVEAAADGFGAAEALFCLRPEDVVLSHAAVVPDSARNHLAGVVRRIIPAGAEVRVEVDCGFLLVAAITRRSLEELGLVVGSPVAASFKATAVHLIPRGGGPRA